MFWKGLFWDFLISPIIPKIFVLQANVWEDKTRDVFCSEPVVYYLAIPALRWSSRRGFLPHLCHGFQARQNLVQQQRCQCICKCKTKSNSYKHANSKHCLLGNVTNLDFCLTFSERFQIIKGFCNWKDVIASFKKHLQSKCHVEVVEAVVILPKCKDVGKQLSRAYQAEKEQARDMLQLILLRVHFLPGND